MSYEILIISQYHFEDTTDEICNWLYHLEANFIRLNIEELYNPKLYSVFSNLEDSTLHIFDKRRQESIDLSKIKVGWCRRFTFKSYFLDLKKDNSSANSETLSKFISSEINIFLKSIFDFYPQIQWFDYYKNILAIDKLDVLKKARKNGLLIPETYISNESAPVKNLLKEKSLITKPIGEVSYFDDDKNKGTYMSHTQEVKYINGEFTPSLFQVKIDKKIEIRTFVLGDDFYSMAIFSSNNKKTAVDFRKYDFRKPNRRIPYQLPKNIEDNLKKLMNELSLKTGSVDLILDQNDNYYFLEVNPIGQFGMVSYPCNYNLEKKVAHFLIEELEKLKI
ncbi:grasp-with-spasm system ATP-grasp peptide maturase [uncultured Chryseobacterium sp.]|uniref:grasp-with-spasm system ATP-grasp peptide maturase n=1 Tax=uncultured Chryseobacterium sp. TaxID=259322 RepID=UPI0025E5A10C|nr:grasp-with-spasm system ATP-grasp peptide maturase [uncultured Chryseobacterium sp.]